MTDFRKMLDNVGFQFDNMMSHFDVRIRAQADAVEKIAADLAKSELSIPVMWAHRITKLEELVKTSPDLRKRVEMIEVRLAEPRDPQSDNSYPAGYSVGKRDGLREGRKQAAIEIRKAWEDPAVDSHEFEEMIARVVRGE